MRNLCAHNDQCPESPQVVVIIKNKGQKKQCCDASWGVLTKHLKSIYQIIVLCCRFQMKFLCIEKYYYDIGYPLYILQFACEDVYTEPNRILF